MSLKIRGLFADVGLRRKVCHPNLGNGVKTVGPMMEPTHREGGASHRDSTLEGVGARPKRSPPEGFVIYQAFVPSSFNPAQ